MTDGNHKRKTANRLAARSPLDMAIILLMLGTTLLIIWLSFTYRSSWSAHWPDYSRHGVEPSRAECLVALGTGRHQRGCVLQTRVRFDRAVGRRLSGLLGESNGKSLARLCHFLRHRIMAVARHQFVARPVAEQPAVGLDGHGHQLATHVCSVCFVAGGDGADVWRRLEGHDQWRNHGRRVRHADVLADRQLRLQSPRIAGGDRQCLGHGGRQRRALFCSAVTCRAW